MGFSAIWRKVSGRAKIIHTLQVYEEIADTFSILRSAPWPIARVIKGGVVLDLGSGSCVNGIHATRYKKGRYLICLDISLSMAVISRRNMVKENVLGDAIAADMFFIPIRDSAADSILSIASLHHIPRVYGLRILREIRRVARPLSIIVVTVWSWRQLRFALSILRNMLLYVLRLVDNVREFYIPWKKRGRIYWRYYYLYSLGELVDVFVRSGLKILSSGYIGYRKTRSDNAYVIGTVAHQITAVKHRGKFWNF
ncbi:MAG: class I SAM-dependent methyltransferase [Ignisphaera sp.]|nr:class I SAM-dependent methyltransferase [Ignisphaera sp.]MCX8167915.1 class I SAM-dependent methyltransferase [Ignisphaera sp.]MDW8085730.1 class I SAM-dependent methyltransferase [Ignisphaera sp.]